MENLSLNIWTCGNFASGSLDADYDGSPTLWMCEWCSFRVFLCSLGRMVEDWIFVESANFSADFFLSFILTNLFDEILLFSSIL
ncbi:unnamed protein product [Rhizophagus irregularis]|nr:unnamed protein product [Rhizophagus irregularis]